MLKIKIFFIAKNKKAQVAQVFLKKKIMKTCKKKEVKTIRKAMKLRFQSIKYKKIKVKNKKT
jgi:hypothetical protein